jgi:hypothetical protein
MNRIHRICRSLAGLPRRVGVLLASAAAAPALLATSPPLPPGWNKHPPLPAQTHTVVNGGMPGWQVTLIAATAVLLAATLAVIVYRMRAARVVNPLGRW